MNIKCCGNPCKGLEHGAFFCSKCGHVWFSQATIDYRKEHGLSVSPEQEEKAKRAAIR